MCKVTVLALVFLLTAYSSAQTPNQPTGESKCSAAMAKSLTIRGIHLGMSKDEVFALFPGASESPEFKQRLQAAQEPPNFGQAFFQLFPRSYSTKERFAGINQISISLFDDRVVGYAIEYEGFPTGPRWNTLDEWIAKLSETLHLPGTGEWIQKSFQQYSKTLNCEGYQIFADNLNARGTIDVHEGDIDQKRAAREKAYQEKKRREFKP